MKTKNRILARLAAMLILGFAPVFGQNVAVFDFQNAPINSLSANASQLGAGFTYGAFYWIGGRRRC